jgi:hypothetical protein
MSALVYSFDDAEIETAIARMFRVRLELTDLLLH